MQSIVDTTMQGADFGFEVAPRRFRLIVILSKRFLRSEGSGRAAAKRRVFGDAIIARLARFLIRPGRYAHRGGFRMPYNSPSTSACHILPANYA